MLDAHQLLWTQIAAGTCLLIFGAMLFNLFRLRRQMQAASKWDKIEGVITVSGVEQPPSHLSDDLNDASPVIRYRYRTGGRELEGDRIRVGGQPLTTRVLAGRQVARFPVGARVDVYVDPNDPSSALLEPQQQGNLAAQLAFTIAFGIAAGILVAHGIAGHVLYTGNGVHCLHLCCRWSRFLRLSSASFHFHGHGFWQAPARDGRLWPASSRRQA